ncbi:MAG: LytTR family DNA-binding domain-containing protein [Ignavibacteriaceae bacterium]|jgi:DNA-binding LytR/AlgR family response regulator
MKLLIIEDEKHAVAKLSRLLYKIDAAIIIVGVLESVEKSINWLNDNPAPDLILMDIRLEDGICFEIFETINVKTPVIFTTAYDEYAIKAFKINSVDYLLKPVDENSLKNAIDKFHSFYYDKHRDIENIGPLLKEFSKQYKNRFLVKIGEHYKSIPTNDICYFYIIERSTFLKTVEGKTFGLDFSLEQIQNTINPGKFFRINRKYIINADSISDIVSYYSNRLLLKLVNQEKNEELVVSREKVSTFKKWMDR